MNRVPFDRFRLFYFLLLSPIGKWIFLDFYTCYKINVSINDQFVFVLLRYVSTLLSFIFSSLFHYTQCDWNFSYFFNFTSSSLPFYRRFLRSSPNRVKNCHFTHKFIGMRWNRVVKSSRTHLHINILSTVKNWYFCALWGLSLTDP